MAASAAARGCGHEAGVGLVALAPASSVGGPALPLPPAAGHYTLNYHCSISPVGWEPTATGPILEPRQASLDQVAVASSLPPSASPNSMRASFTWRIGRVCDRGPLPTVPRSVGSRPARSNRGTCHHFPPGSIRFARVIVQLKQVPVPRSGHRVQSRQPPKMGGCRTLLCVKLTWS